MARRRKHRRPYRNPGTDWDEKESYRVMVRRGGRWVPSSGLYHSNATDADNEYRAMRNEGYSYDDMYIGVYNPHRRFLRRSNEAIRRSAVTHHDDSGSGTVLLWIGAGAFVLGGLYYLTRPSTS